MTGFLAAWVPAACSPRPNLPTDVDAVRAADSAWAKAVESKSVEQTVAFYDTEALTAGSAMSPARGTAGFRRIWMEAFSQPGFRLTWQVESVAVTESGTIAYSTGSYQLGATDRTGPYLAVWRKQSDGQWKVLIDAAWFAGAAQ